MDSTGQPLRTSDFDFSLPPELIAQTPVEPRDASRLMVLRREGQQIEHRRFSDLGEYLDPGDLLVLNDTRVLRARLSGSRLDTGGEVELLLLHPMSDGSWECMMRPARQARPGRRLAFGAIEAEVIERSEAGTVFVRFDGDPEEAGAVPLPPYIHEELADAERYQTVYARERGSAAAPTAGLHFTPELLQALADSGVEHVWVTLHIGPGTFKPVRVEDPRQHPMHAEAGVLGGEAASAINAAKAAGHRVVCVGTTSVRITEQAAREARTRGLSQSVMEWSGWTDLLILPGDPIYVADALVTNFHLPRSTLLMLISAFAGREFVLRAYEEAIRERYRFYSFGDAMLIL